MTLANSLECLQNWQPWKLIAENTYEHYQDHLQDAQAFLEANARMFGSAFQLYNLYHRHCFAWHIDALTGDCDAFI